MTAHIGLTGTSARHESRKADSRWRNVVAFRLALGCECPLRDYPERKPEDWRTIPSRVIAEARPERE